MRRRLAFAATLALAGVGVALALLLTGGSDAGVGAFRGSEPPPGIKLPAFELHDYTGAVVRSQDTAGKVVLVTFLDTQCTSSCPVIASQIGLGLDRLTPEQLRDVVPLGITSDPPEDTPESVRAFLRRHRVEGRLHYLVGSVGELRPVWRAFLVSASFDTGVDDIHSAPVRIFDRNGIWVSTLHAAVDLTPENLANDIVAALESE